MRIFIDVMKVVGVIVLAFFVLFLYFLMMGRI